MEISKKISEFKMLVVPVGRLDIDTAVEFGHEVNDAIDDNDIRDLVIDCSGINYVSSIGLRVLLELKKRMKLKGSMTLTSVSDEVMEVFKITGFDKIITII